MRPNDEMCPAWEFAEMVDSLLPGPVQIASRVGQILQVQEAVELRCHLLEEKRGRVILFPYVLVEEAPLLGIDCVKLVAVWRIGIDRFDTWKVGIGMGRPPPAGSYHLGKVEGVELSIGGFSKLRKGIFAFRFAARTGYTSSFRRGRGQPVEMQESGNSMPERDDMKCRCCWHGSEAWVPGMAKTCEGEAAVHCNSFSIGSSR